MIIPNTKLLLWLTGIGVPMAVLCSTVPESAPTILITAAGLALVVLIDALNAGRNLGGISVGATPLVRMQKGNEALFPLEFHNESGVARLLRVGVVFPAPLGAIDQELAVALPPESALSRVQLRCRPLQRGSYRVSLGGLEISSPLGLWIHRRKLVFDAEVRVYPDLMDERKRLSSLFLTRGRYGLRTLRQAGKGRDFEKVRDYVAGDPVEDIHWKATAKRGRPVTKVFQIEQKQEVYVILDASRLSTVRGPDGNTVFERFVTTALVLALAARQQGDSFGLAVFGNQLLRFVHARSGHNHFQVCREMLCALGPSAVAPDFQEIATAIRLRLRKRALIVFLTSLADSGTAEAFVKTVPPLCRQHLLAVNMIRPPAVAPLFSQPLQSGGGLSALSLNGRRDASAIFGVRSVDEIYEHLGGHLVWSELRELQKQLQREGVIFSMLDHERFALDIVSQYLEIKARQVL